MIVGPKLCVRWTFLPDCVGKRHTCVLLFAPTQQGWHAAIRVTECWYQFGWCSHDERQLFLNDVWRKIDSAAPTVKVRIAG